MEPSEQAGKKSDKATIAQRIEEVLRLRLDGQSFAEIVQFGSVNRWKVCDRQIRKYIARADRLLIERLDSKRKLVVARHIARREHLYRLALLAGDYSTALRVLNNEAKLRGLYPTNEVKNLLKALAEQSKRIAELEDRLARATSQEQGRG